MFCLPSSSADYEGEDIYDDEEENEVLLEEENQVPDGSQEGDMLNKSDSEDEVSLHFPLLSPSYCLTSYF